MLARLEKLKVSAYTIPTDLPEGDGTLDWNETTLVLVQASAGSKTGLGYTYADSSTARLIQDKLLPLLPGHDLSDIPALWDGMKRVTRNLGHSGIAAMAISAVDTALWDLKARILGLPLCNLLGIVRSAIPLYGSGGFTSYTLEQLREQLGRSRLTVAMLSRKRSSVSDNQIGCFIAEFFVSRHSFPVLQTKVYTGVDHSLSKVAIKCAAISVFL
jgi:L-alanine-DL-glutamate epimerase-like enolase superfamily enzyme